jgi:hypothetical protein
LSARGLIFKQNTKNKVQNLYVRTLEETIVDGKNIIDRVGDHLYLNYLSRRTASEPETPFYVLGEIFGRGVQDLHYGQAHPTFRIFDVYVGKPGQGHYLSYINLLDLLYGVEDAVLVPEVYVGEFSKEIIEQHTNGLNVDGGFNIREGVVIKSAFERTDEELGRVILKSVSEDYLLRKGGTEYN